jgi:protein O-mannosyl-transferase
MGRQAKLKSRPRTTAEASAPVAVDPPAWKAPPAVALAVAIALLTLAVFGRVLGHEFITLDDPLYVSQNEVVKRGLSGEGIRYAFTTFDTGNWIPLTWLSLMLDVTLFGPKAGAMAFVNVLLHATSAVALFLALQRMTAAPWRSAAVAALFAVHPLRVESVAWVSERKDVLSTLFAFLALLAYANHARGRSSRAYVSVIVLFALGLLSKPMLVTLPFVLLLLDWWPLQRMSRQTALRLVLEKVPLIALAAASSAVTVVAQRAGGAMTAADILPLVSRIENAIVAYARYIGMLLWPSGLAVFYPYDYSISTLRLTLSLFLLLAITAAAVMLRHSAPWLFTGWFVFTGTLVPVIGIVQVGLQSIADRYTYIPSVGLLIVLVWAAAMVARRLMLAPAVLASLGVAVVLMLAVASFLQTGRWRDSITLFSHAVAVTENNGLGHHNLGLAFREAGDSEAALRHQREAVNAAIRSTPPREIAGVLSVTFPSWYPRAQNEAAAELIERGRQHAEAGREEQSAGAYREAILRLEQAVKIDPGFQDAKTNLATAYALSGRGGEAAEMAAGADSYDAKLNLGAVLSREGRIDEALEQFRAAAAMQPGSVEPLIYLSLGLGQAGREQEALAAVEKAASIDREEANELLTRALRLPPGPANLDEYIAWLRSPQDR